MNKEELWKQIEFEVEHQLYDLFRGDEEEDNASSRAKLAIDNIKGLLTKNGYELVRTSYPERDCSVYLNKKCNCKEGQCDDLMY